ncbi:hypothetical protein [Sulfurovum sp. NBC37-1]|uniref:hypothetical protein n=1 Tax=Sulfurovum sp. (strain NBC37-1) TaxID=387093 RepID=UPI00015879E0|nr:hypothetical protein [Sulfurovum sp. NBC37-1]BAF72392.1 hypothetical protein SUN_1441 [Sulfurovum sp. NBC37-1]
MLTLKGTLLNIFTNSDFTKEDGTVVPGKTKLQLLVKTHMRNGELRNELYDLSIPIEKLELYRQKIGKEVEVEVALVGKAVFYGI